MKATPPRCPGRAASCSPSGFEGDAGAADPVLRAALATPGDDLALMRAVEASRFVVPVIAEPTEVDTSASTRSTPGSTWPRSPSWRPTASGPCRLHRHRRPHRWDPGARPVPVTPARAGQAAVSEGCDVIVVDVAGPATRVLRPSMVWALAQQRPWEPAHTDPFVDRSVAAAVRDEDEITAYELEEGNPRGEGVLGIVLDLRPGLAPEQVRALASRVGERLATDGELRARIDGLAFRLR